MIMRQFSLACELLAVVLLSSMFFNAPIGDIAIPGLSANPTKAPWYFMGIQEMLMHFHPVFALLVIPGLLLFGLLSIPYINYEGNTTGVWFCSHKGRKMALAAVVCATLLTAGAVLLNEFVIGAGQTGAASLINNGLVPFVIVLAVCTGFYWMVKRSFKATNNEAVQALFTLLVTAFVVLTIIGVWFRGAGMQLMWSA